MAEDDFYAIRAGSYRSSRYPGYTSGGRDTVTGNALPSPVISNPSSLTPNVANDSGSSSDQQGSVLRDLYADIPTPKAPSMGEMVEPLVTSGIQSAGTWAGGQIGGVAGAEMAAGAGLGDALGKGASALGDKVTGWFSGPAAEAGSGVASSVAPGTVLTGVEDAPIAAAAGGAATSGVAETMGSRMTSGGTIGSAAGSGIARAGIGLITGEKPATAVKAGLGTAAGTYIGTVVGGGPIGGFIGGAIGGVVGGRVICTELAERGLLPIGLLWDDVAFTRRSISPITFRGYHFWAVPFVRLMRRSAIVTAFARPLAVWRAEEISYLLGKRPRGSWKGKLVRLIGEPACYLIGLCVGETDWKALYKENANA